VGREYVLSRQFAITRKDTESSLTAGSGETSLFSDLIGVVGSLTLEDGLLEYGAKRAARLNRLSEICVTQVVNNFARELCWTCKKEVDILLGEPKT
jgi:hypothetical protein